MNTQSLILNHRSPIFTFSQASLQSYVDCKRRFQLRYLLRLAWPAPEAQPVVEHEAYMQRGESFHRLVQQFLLGMPQQRLDPQATADPLLARWWRDFQGENPIPDDYTTYVEIHLSTPLGGHRLVARYDAVAVGQGRTLIFDWKTSKNRPKSHWLKDRLQSRVYPFVLTQAGAQLNDGVAVDPDLVEMVYWFSNFPNAPLRYPYSQSRYRQDNLALTQLIEEIAALRSDEYPRTEDLKHCRYCVYRSYCNRGVEAGGAADLDKEYALGEDLVEAFDLDLDLDQIAEIEF